MPFAEEHDKHYLCVTLPIADDKVSPELLASFCSRIISLLDSSGGLNDLEGVELFLGAKGKRLMRLSVLSESLGKATLLRPADLAEGGSSAGLTCIMYQPWPV